MSASLDHARAMRAALLVDGAPDLAGLRIAGAPARAARRFEVYRENVRRNLVGALALSFPAVGRLVGADFFDAAATVFLRASPPDDPDLYRFGVGFAAFLEGFPPAASLPWLGDVARVEWAVGASLRARRAPALTARGLAALAAAADARLVVHPSLGLVRLAHDAHRVWSATMIVDEETRAAALAALSPRAGRFRLAVARADDGVAIIELDGAEDAFLAALVAGADFETALERAPGLDATAAIARFLDEALFAEPSEGNRT